MRIVSNTAECMTREREKDGRKKREYINIEEDTKKCGGWDDNNNNNRNDEIEEKWHINAIIIINNNPYEEKCAQSLQRDVNRQKYRSRRRFTWWRALAHEIFYVLLNKKKAEEDVPESVPMVSRGVCVCLLDSLLHMDLFKRNERSFFLLRFGPISIKQANALRKRQNDEDCLFFSLRLRERFDFCLGGRRIRFDTYLFVLHEMSFIRDVCVDSCHIPTIFVRPHGVTMKWFCDSRTQSLELLTVLRCTSFRRCTLLIFMPFFSFSFNPWPKTVEISPKREKKSFGALPYRAVLLPVLRIYTAFFMRIAHLLSLGFSFGGTWITFCVPNPSHRSALFLLSN